MRPTRRRNLSPHVTRGGRLWRQIAQVHRGYPTHLHILDARQPVITKGPDSGRSVPGTGLILASRDPIALDATGTALLKVLGAPKPSISEHGAWDQPVLQEALASPWIPGIRSPEDLTIRAHPEEEVLGELRRAARS